MRVLFYTAAALAASIASAIKLETLEERHDLFDNNFA